MVVPEEERRARATLCAIAEPGEILLGRIVARAGPCRALAVVRGEEPPPEGISITEGGRRRLAAWRARLQAADTEADLAVCAELGIRLVCPGDPEWPVTLDDLGDRRPYALWLRGPLDLRYSCLRSVAIVGARAASPYGVRIASELGAELADAGWTVVSGGALGIDAAAHRGTLAADGQTIAVFANGLDRFYPAGNEALFVEMLHKGLLVSESPPGTDPHRLRFLVRNRVIAALTRGTVVVEAAARSGALNTAVHARDLGRALMAVPGPVDSKVSVGCHKLLRDTPPARCVTTAAEVLEEVGRIGADLAPPPRGPVLPRDMLDPVTRSVLEALPARGAAGPAQIAVRAGVDLATATSRLGQLSAAGFIERAPGGWRLRRSAKLPSSPV
ncbi:MULTISPECIES: DNA-processing protein DprA [Thermomonospora]|mgnify:FL=1|uniref:DNA protecting protein DprA n=1 Tax=Thermomonospora curvata (strain ATCC 19995 / DSM 43183 / JCM 3096 / KCTC 9072 / NBRC 15933 / NCIMB 10081 / Henssen B9) TaxID=471852 RepID=D1AB10_THECD|nr:MULTISPECIES: DNA-processing protein DprA [Thermomonospora]ACY98953.1 DNA protecting protein DprA [Thermomonospora curvata DSM 43183]PKK13148.1 MAG: DNA-protecting protein DprA [Thermomonospora sp. CIF 1]